MSFMQTAITFLFISFVYTKEPVGIGCRMTDSISNYFQCQNPLEEDLSSIQSKLILSQITNDQITSNLSFCQSQFAISQFRLLSELKINKNISIQKDICSSNYSQLKMVVSGLQTQIETLNTHINEQIESSYSQKQKFSQELADAQANIESLTKNFNKTQIDYREFRQEAISQQSQAQESYEKLEKENRELKERIKKDNEIFIVIPICGLILFIIMALLMCSNQHIPWSEFYYIDSNDTPPPPTRINRTYIVDKETAKRLRPRMSKVRNYKRAKLDKSNSENATLSTRPTLVGVGKVSPLPSRFLAYEPASQTSALYIAGKVNVPVASSLVHAADYSPLLVSAGKVAQMQLFNFVKQPAIKEILLVSVGKVAQIHQHLTHQPLYPYLLISVGKVSNQHQQPLVHYPDYSPLLVSVGKVTQQQRQPFTHLPIYSYLPVSAGKFIPEYVATFLQVDYSAIELDPQFVLQQKQEEAEKIEKKHQLKLELDGFGIEIENLKAQHNASRQIIQKIAQPQPVQQRQQPVQQRQPVQQQPQPQPSVSPLDAQPISVEEPDVPSFFDKLFEMEGYPLIPVEDRKIYGKYDIYGVYNRIPEKSPDLDMAEVKKKYQQAYDKIIYVDYSNDNSFKQQAPISEDRAQQLIQRARQQKLYEDQMMVHRARFQQHIDQQQQRHHQQQPQPFLPPSHSFYGVNLPSFYGQGRK